MSNHTPLPNPYIKTTYILISIILLLPILLWPVALLIFDHPMLENIVQNKWSLSIIILLIAVLGMDTILYGINSKKQVFDAILWLGVVSVLILHNQSNVWFLALLFIAHSLRSGFYLFTDNHHGKWWISFAWARDITAAFIILFWVSL